MSEQAKPMLVIGGGIAGMTAAIEAAEVGVDVVLVEREAYLGGRTMRTHRYFPKMCPPTCGFEINVRRIRQNPRITVHTLATVESLEGSVGAFRAQIRVRPRFVSGSPAFDGATVDGLTSERTDTFNLGLSTTKALYHPHDMAWPSESVVDRDALSAEDAQALAAVVDLEAEDAIVDLEVGAVVVATGWRPYDAANLGELGFGSCENVVTNVMVERMAASAGPTGGRIVRPSDGETPANVAFVQCAGSRDENHLPYCSAVCCMASLKQARYVRQASEETRVTIFYIDIRTIGRHEGFYLDLLEDEGVSFFKGKVAGVREDGDAQRLVLDVEDTLAAEMHHDPFDLVVLATGVVPTLVDHGIPFDLEADAYGFLDATSQVEGVFVAGCAHRPCDVSRSTKDAACAALKAIQCLRGGA